MAFEQLMLTDYLPKVVWEKMDLKCLLKMLENIPKQNDLYTRGRAEVVRRIIVRAKWLRPGRKLKRRQWERMSKGQSLIEACRQLGLDPKDFAYEMETARPMRKPNFHTRQWLLLNPPDPNRASLFDFFDQK